MKYTPYLFQKVAVDHAVEFLRTAEPGHRTLYAAPTGCGKSVVELLVQAAFDDLWIVTPRDEIVQGMLDKLGDADGDPMDHRICTPVKLRNRLLSGAVRHPGKLAFDEGHHHEAETWQQLDLLTGFAPSVAYTATPYRGTPKSTRQFREFWGEPLWLITYQEAVDEKYISMPTFSMLPLVDDDIVDVQGGDFAVTSIDSATVDRLGDMAEHARRWYRDGLWDRATVFAMPSTACCVRLAQELANRGLPAAIVSAGTPRCDRQGVFRATSERIVALLHINIVSEGVDMPFRRLVDLAPTLSPVRWVQQLGRVTRPVPHGEPPPEYICTNRNLLRHAYALEGIVPVSAFIEAEKVLPPSTRGHARVLGLEALGRFKPTTVKLLNGCTAQLYSLSTVTDVGLVVQYCCVASPTCAPVWASRIDRVDDGKRVYGSWLKCEAPTDLKGFASVGPREITPKQKSWWTRCARRYGLDPEQEVTRKNFQTLPVLADTGVRVQ